METTIPVENRSRRDWPKPTQRQPKITTLEKWSFDMVAQATDGCRVELDGSCPHGHVSWFLYLGLI